MHLNQSERELLERLALSADGHTAESLWFVGIDWCAVNNLVCRGLVSEKETPRGRRFPLTTAGRSLVEPWVSETVALLELVGI